jgi:hypothetical protein
MEPRIEELTIRVYTVPTDAPEADDTLNPTGGVIRPDPDAPGLGLTLRAADADDYRVRREPGARR